MSVGIETMLRCSVHASTIRAALYADVERTSRTSMCTSSSYAGNVLACMHCEATPQQSEVKLPPPSLLGVMASRRDACLRLGLLGWIRSLLPPPCFPPCTGTYAASEAH